MMTECFFSAKIGADQYIVSPTKLSHDHETEEEVEGISASQCQMIIFLSNTELDEKQVFDNNRSVLPPALSNNTGQMTVSCG